MQDKTRMRILAVCCCVLFAAMAVSMIAWFAIGPAGTADPWSERTLAGYGMSEDGVARLGDAMAEAGVLSPGSVSFEAKTDGYALSVADGGLGTVRVLLDPDMEVIAIIRADGMEILYAAGE